MTPTNKDLAATLREIADILPLGFQLIVRLAADRLAPVEHREPCGDPDREPWKGITDGWITHDGKGRPDLPDGTITETRHRDGEEFLGEKAWPVQFWYDGPGFWIHDGTHSDIVAYRIVK